MTGCGGRRLPRRIALRANADLAWWTGVSVPALATTSCGHKSLPFLFRRRHSHGGGNGAAHRFCSGRGDRGSRPAMRLGVTDGGSA